MAVPSLRALCSKNGGPSDDVTENPFSPSSRAFYCRMICQYTSPGIQYLHAVLQRHAAAVFLSNAAAAFFFVSPFPPSPLSPESSWKITPNVSLRLPCRSCFVLWSIYLQRQCAAAWAGATARPGCGQPFKREVCAAQHSTDTLSNTAAQLMPVFSRSAVWLRWFNGE